MTAPNFDPLARVYRLLELLAFGGDLERARFCLLDHLSDRRSILVLGEGDGRCLEQLLPRTPLARIHCLEASPAMLARARNRIAGLAGCERVTFECTDALRYPFSPERYDAVVTLFFLDCFETASATALVARVSAALQPEARWMLADFTVPPRGAARVRARIWLAVLYAFFRWQTGLKPRELPPSEQLIHAAGFTPQLAREFQWGLLRTVLFVRNLAKPGGRCPTGA